MKTQKSKVLTKKWQQLNAKWDKLLKLQANTISDLSDIQAEMNTTLQSLLQVIIDGD